MKTCQYKTRVTNQVEGEAEIMLYGTIGEDFFAMEESITAKKFVGTLADLKNIKKITLRINSGGGSVFDAQAIYNALVRHPAHVTAYIDGIAASAASWIAMAGDEILMAENGLFMYHLSQGMTMGDRWEHAKAIKIFDKIDGIIAGTYAKRTGKNAAELLEQMRNETWLTAAEAKEAGFVSGIIESKGQPTACVGPECAKLYRAAPVSARRFFKGGAMSVHNGCKCGGAGSKTNAASQECIAAKVAEGMTLEDAAAACEAETATEASVKENVSNEEMYQCNVCGAEFSRSESPYGEGKVCPVCGSENIDLISNSAKPDNAGPSYEEGCQVAMSQGSASSNPYESGTKEWEDWQAGFESCGAGNDAEKEVKNSAAYDEGFDAGIEGESAASNPYDKDPEKSDWLDGWADGFASNSPGDKANELIECPFCDGTGVCDHCDGEAVMPDGSDCPECKDGSCIVCEGTGTVENEAKKPANAVAARLAAIQRDEVAARLAML